MIAMKTRLIAVLFLPCAGVVAAPVAPGNMKAYCRGEASAQFATKPQYIKTGKLTRNKDGSYSIKGRADLGAEGLKPFQCNFDRKGNFQPLMSLVNEGKL